MLFAAISVTDEVLDESQMKWMEHLTQVN